MNNFFISHKRLILGTQATYAFRVADHAENMIVDLAYHTVDVRLLDTSTDKPHERGALLR